MLKKISEIGILIGEDAVSILKNLNDKEKEILLKRLERLKEKPVVLDKKITEKLISKPKIIKKFIWKRTYSIQDMINYYSERYNQLQKIISKKIENPVSIINCSGNSNIIGMIREIDKKLLVEDSTGAINVVLKNELERPFLLDDVIGIEGRREGNEFFAYKIVYPDISLRNPVFVPSNLVYNRNLEIDGEKIECKNGFIDIMGLQILVTDIRLSEIFKKIRAEEAALELLKKRHLANPPDDVISIEPDIFLVIDDKYFTENYKGTTIIGIPEGKSIKIDLSTREIEEG